MQPAVGRAKDGHWSSRAGCGTRMHCQNGKMKGIFDLSDRQVENPTTGIYIVDGNKVLVK